MVHLHSRHSHRPSWSAGSRNQSPVIGLTENGQPVTNRPAFSRAPLRYLGFLSVPRHPPDWLSNGSVNKTLQVCEADAYRGKPDHWPRNSYRQSCFKDARFSLSSDCQNWVNLAGRESIDDPTAGPPIPRRTPGSSAGRIGMRVWDRLAYSLSTIRSR